MSSVTRHARYSLAEYLELEEFANVKHEFVDGQIYALAGWTPEHGAIAMRLGAVLVEHLRGRPCVVYSSDVRVRVVETGLDTYPDLSVVCGEVRRDVEDPNALANPIVLVEVMSPSSEDYDRGEKLEHYKKLPALREVLLVGFREPSIEVWSRGDGEWSVEVARRGSTARIPSIDCRLEIDEVFRDPMSSSS